MRKVSVKNSIFVGLILFLMTAGCGLKGNPVPSASVVLTEQAKQQLAVSARENAAVLTWQLHDPDGKITYIHIEKSELGSPGNVCRDCPRTFQSIGQIQVLNIKKETNGYSFSDVNVEKGKIYSYRLKLCNENGVCRESQTAELNYQ